MNHADEKPCVNLIALGEDLRGLITSQGYIGSSPFKRLSYQTCGRRTHLCHFHFNLGPSWLHYVAINIFFFALGLRPWVTFKDILSEIPCRSILLKLIIISSIFLRQCSWNQDDFSGFFDSNSCGSVCPLYPSSRLQSWNIFSQPGSFCCCEDGWICDHLGIPFVWGRSLRV